MLRSRFLVSFKLASVQRRARARLAILVTVGFLSVAGLAWWYALGRPPDEPEAAVNPGPEKPPSWLVEPQTDRSSEAGRPIVMPSAGYVGSDACVDCHTESHATWFDTYHRTMTQVATPKSVLGRFDGKLILDGKDYLVERVGDEFWVEMDDPDILAQQGRRKRTRKRVVMVTGSHHMQVYWYSIGKSRILGQFPLVYLLQDAQRWIPRDASFLRPPSDRAPSETTRWNVTCNKCHSTHPRPRLVHTQLMDTQVSEFGISCEACHGPGERHVLEHRAAETTAAADGAVESRVAMVNPENLSHQRSAQVCGQCHGVTHWPDEASFERWKRHGWDFRPGYNLHESRLVLTHDAKDPAIATLLKKDPELLDRTFWPDGMIRAAGQEYIGLLNTPCVQRGSMSCLSCHEMHKKDDDPRPTDEWANDLLKPEMRSNLACTQCHKQFPDKEKLTAHTHHLAESSGSNCYNCHMPHTTYALLKAIRSHQISSPSLAVTLATGRPIACNMCHLDQTLEWTGQHLTSWYNAPAPRLTDEQNKIAASVVGALRGDALQRAFSAWSMGWPTARAASGEDWLAPYLVELLKDPYPAVRLIAERSLRRLPGFAEVDYDPFDPPPLRAKHVAVIFDRWQRRHAQSQSPKTGKAILIDETGKLRRATIEHLLQNRDLRPVSIDE